MTSSKKRKKRRPTGNDEARLFVQKRQVIYRLNTRLYSIFSITYPHSELLSRSISDIVKKTAANFI